jgi:protein-disulfide isomerase
MTGLKRRRIGLLAGTALIAAAIVAVLAVASSSDDGRSGLGDGRSLSGAAETNRLLRGIPQDGTALGSPDAPVTVVEFVDLQCPFCGQFAAEALPDFIRRYVRPGKVRLELRVLRFLGPDSQRAAGVAAAAAEQDKLWQFAELLFRNQGRENSGYVTDDFLRGVASGVDGLDVDRALDAAEDAPAGDLVAAAEGHAQRLGVNGTPSFFGVAGKGRPRPLQLSELSADALGDQVDELLADRR